MTLLCTEKLIMLVTPGAGGADGGRRLRRQRRRGRRVRPRSLRRRRWRSWLLRRLDLGRPLGGRGNSGGAAGGATWAPPCGITGGTAGAPPE